MSENPFGLGNPTTIEYEYYVHGTQENIKLFISSLVNCSVVGPTAKEGLNGEIDYFVLVKANDGSEIVIPDYVKETPKWIGIAAVGVIA